MNLLKPGYVPNGWKRGDSISTQMSIDSRKGRVYWSPDTPVKDVPAIGAIDFNDSDLYEVKDWVKWWFAHD